MATVLEIHQRLTPFKQSRYPVSRVIIWLNDLLEKLSGESFTMKTLDQEIGAIVENNKWVKIPDGCRVINKVFDPTSEEIVYSFKEVNGKLKLRDVTVDELESPDSVSAFTNHATTYVDVDISDAEAGDYANFLLVITGGTYSGKTYVINNNDASAGGVCRLYFENELETAFDGTKTTAGKLYGEDYYVMLECSVSYDTVSESSDEVPIDDRYERRITTAYLNLRMEEDTETFGNGYKVRKNQFDEVLYDLKCELRSSAGLNKISPRGSPGFDRMSSSTYFPYDPDSRKVHLL